MPELPEVETIKEAMRNAIDGALIKSVRIRNRHLRQKIPDNFENIVCLSHVRRLYRIAKYAIMELDNGYCIIWHFGMSGKIKIEKESGFALEKHDHVVISTSKGILIYNDPRRFGLVSLIETTKINENPLFSNLGCDPFDKQFTSTYLINKLCHKHIPIKTALLDQSIVAGIGNIYASEALYEAHISPLRECCSITEKESKSLIEAIRITLKKAINAGGSTLHDYRQPDGNIGYFQLQHAVYGKEGETCPRCAKKHPCKIQRITQGGRSTYYCPHTQK